MEPQLENILMEINSFKALLQRNEEEKEKLKTTLITTLKENKILEDTYKSLLLEASDLQSVVSTLQGSILILEGHEAERNCLLFEKEKLENHIAEINKAYEKQCEVFKNKIKEMTIIHQQDKNRCLQQLNNQASIEIENHLNIIKEKDKYIFQLEDDISVLKSSGDKCLLQLKFEYEEKIRKLRSQISKNKGSTISINTQRDVFRQKFLQIEKEAKEKELLMQKEIDELKIQIKQLKSQEYLKFPEKSPRNGKTELVCEITDVSSSMCEGSYEDEYMQREKRFKPGYYTEQSFTKLQKFPVEQVKPERKKLFNVELNYLDK